jgi:hypothetical protein
MAGENTKRNPIKSRLGWWGLGLWFCVGLAFFTTNDFTLIKSKES